jgi:hypothetical protein
MANPLGDFMANWLNTTYKYLQESGGGPTYPAKTITTGPGVLPSGGFSLVEDVGINYDTPITQYGTVPLPFNPHATGIPASANSQDEYIEEITKGNPTPPTLSSNFQRLYSGMMKACIDDQKHRHCNPNALSACQKLADMGDPSEMILTPIQKEAIGLTPLPEENAKSDVVRLAEEKASLTGQIKTGMLELSTIWSGFAGGTGSLMKSDPSGNKTVNGNPAGVNFRAIGESMKGFIPQMPTAPDFNSPFVLIGGAVVLVVLLIAVVK